MNARAYGSKLYLTGTEKMLFDKVEEKINLKKAAALSKGSNVVYTKSWLLNQEIVSELSEKEPTNEILKWNPVYRQQIISKSCRILGFEKRGKHTKPLLELKI